MSEAATGSRGEGQERQTSQANTDTASSIRKFGQQGHRMPDVMVKADENWFVGTLMKFFK